MREQIKDGESRFVENQEKKLQSFSQEFIMLTALMGEYQVFSRGYNPSDDLKFIKHSVENFCAKADYLNSQKVTATMCLKAHIDNLDVRYHKSMMLCLASWMRAAGSCTVEDTLFALKDKQQQIDQLQETAAQLLAIVKQSKAQLDKNAYKEILQKITGVTEEDVEALLFSLVKNCARQYQHG